MSCGTFRLLPLPPGWRLRMQNSRQGLGQARQLQRSQNRVEWRRQRRERWGRGSTLRACTASCWEAAGRLWSARWAYLLCHRRMAPCHTIWVSDGGARVARCTGMGDRPCHRESMSGISFRAERRLAMCALRAAWECTLRSSTGWRAAGVGGRRGCRPPRELAPLPSMQRLITKHALHPAPPGTCSVHPILYDAGAATAGERRAREVRRRLPGTRHRMAGHA